MESTSPVTPDLVFKVAFEEWIKTQILDDGGLFTDAHYLGPRSVRDLRQYARSAGRFFDKLRLDEIHVGHLREYQRARAVCDPACGDWPHRAGTNLIKKEIGTLVRVMKAAGAWTAHHEEFFQPLTAVEADVPRAMSPDEQRGWLKLIASRPEWRLIYYWTIVALQTTMSTNEMRALRLGDIFLEQGVLQVRNEGAKNKFRIRTIPFETPQIVWALNGLLERAAQLGARAKFHYLFPLHITADRYDANQPMTVWGIRKPWEACRAAAGLAWLRPYDLRHTAITRMAEAGVPIQVIMSFAGHISERMQQHYTAISMQAKRRWMAAAFAGVDMGYAFGAEPHPAGGYGPHSQAVLPDARESEAHGTFVPRQKRCVG